MLRWFYLIAFSLLALEVGGSFQKAIADSLEIQTKSLDLITGTADRICSIVQMAGNSQSIKVTGEVKAQLAGLIKQLADLGVSGAGSFNSDQFEGVLREDLATTVQRNAECKLKVFDKLQEKMIR